MHGKESTLRIRDNRFRRRNADWNPDRRTVSRLTQDSRLAADHRTRVSGRVPTDDAGNVVRDLSRLRAGERLLVVCVEELAPTQLRPVERLDLPSVRVAVFPSSSWRNEDYNNIRIDGCD